MRSEEKKTTDIMTDTLQGHVVILGNLRAAVRRGLVLGNMAFASGSTKLCGAFGSHPLGLTIRFALFVFLAESCAWYLRMDGMAS